MEERINSQRCLLINQFRKEIKYNISDRKLNKANNKKKKWAKIKIIYLLFTIDLNLMEAFIVIFRNLIINEKLNFLKKLLLILMINLFQRNKLQIVNNIKVMTGILTSFQNSLNNKIIRNKIKNKNQILNCKSNKRHCSIYFK